MSVFWRGAGRSYAHAGLCVSCGGCNAAVGEECKPGWHTGGTSTDRLETANALGFQTVTMRADDLFARTREDTTP